MSLSSSTSLNIDNEGVSNNGKKALKEGPVQMTSLSTLLSFHRYYFLYQDTLFVSKQKGPGSFKLKEKLKLSDVWIASSNTVDSFLLGWPMTNYLVHFRSSEEKEEWFEILGYFIQQNLKPTFTMISMDINVRGRKQTIRRRVENGKKSGELVYETANDLALTPISYELKLVVGDSSGKTLQGPENVYAVIMHEIQKSGIRISDSQKQSLDTYPMLNCRLVLSTMKSTKTSTPMQFVNSIKKKVLHRMDSRSLLGKELDAATPPQTIMTIVDHLKIFGCDTEGIFRKSPKQSTFRELRTEMEKGLVPDFNKYSTHVLASMLKEYLRSIPGKILQSSNYDMWMKEVVDEEDMNKKASSARNLLTLLPSPHLMLLSNVLKLLAKISASPSSKMTASALSVCLGPSFLESTDQIEGGKKIPLLVEFLINHAADVVPGFNSDCVFSILQNIDHNSNMVPSPSVCSDDDTASQKTPIIEEIDAEDDALSQSSLADSISVNSVAHAPSASHTVSPGAGNDNSSRNLPASSFSLNSSTNSTSSLPGSLKGKSVMTSFSATSTIASPTNCHQMTSTASTSSTTFSSSLGSSISTSASSASLTSAAPSGLSGRLGNKLISDSEEELDEEQEQNLNDALKMLLLKKQQTTETKETSKESCGVSSKIEERRSGDTPRSPCLKRIHFQRTQEAQHRNANKQNGTFGFSSLSTSPTSTLRSTRSETSPRASSNSSASTSVAQTSSSVNNNADTDLITVRHVSNMSAIFEQQSDVRRESKEEATQTIDIDESHRANTSRFPAFRSTTSSLAEIKNEVPSSPRFERRDYLERLREVKPTVQVHPFMNKESMLAQNGLKESTCSTPSPSTSSLSDRLTQLWERRMEEVATPPAVESPRFVRKNFVSSASAVPPPPVATSTPKLYDDYEKNQQQQLPILITEKFPPYCIEPITDYGSLNTKRKEMSPDEVELPKRVELQRSSSQREQKSPGTMQRDLQSCRAYSVKARRDRNEYIGMDPLEINWSVRQLKTLFQDKRAPSIDTDYNCPNF